MSQPATAAIIVASIFGSLAALFFGYKAYRKIWTWRHQNLLLPPIREASSAYHGTTNTVSHPSGLASVPATSSNRGSLYATSPVGNSALWPHGLPSNTSSERASPSIGALDSVLVSNPIEAFDARSRTMSSSSSTMTLTRAYHKSSSASQLSFSSPARRESYLPHSPLNRDMIQIVPPQPLGFGGTMAMAADQKTLTFSQNSGIGLGGDDFTSGLLWTQSDARPRSAPRAHLADQDRKRYLMQGPSSSLRDSDKSSLQSFAASSQSPSQGSSLRIHSGTQSPVDSRPMTLSTSASTMQSSEAPSTGPIDSKTLDAEISPLQRLQSRASAAPHTRSTSAANSLSAGSHESPILSPFAPPLASPFVPSSVPTTTSSPIHG